MRALRLCHTTSQWRGTTAEQHGCCVSMTTVLLLLSQHIDRTAWAVNMLTEERVVRELLGGAPPCRRLSREAHSSRTSYSSTARRTRKSPTEVTSARAVRRSLRSAICQLPASARSSWSSNLALLETGADMVVHHQGARARCALGTHAAAPDHVVNMLIDEQQYSRHADAAAVLLCGRATPP